MSDVAILIPALNESATIAGLVEALGTHGTPVVIDDGSDDGTGELATRAGAQVLRHERNQGYDGALRTGIRWALDQGFPLLVTIDGDGQHDPALVDRLVEPLRSGAAELVLGVRDHHARRSEVLFSAYTRRRFGVDDILCGAKAYSAAVGRAHTHELDRRSIGTALALAAIRSGARHEQLPVTIRRRESGQTRFGRGAGAELQILRALGTALWLDVSRSRL